MFGNNQRTHANKHYQCRNENTVLIRWQEFLTESIFIDQTIGYKYSIIVTLSKNKCRKNNIHYIELHTKKAHDAQNPYPPYCHWQKSEYAKFKSSEG